MGDTARRYSFRHNLGKGSYWSDFYRDQFGIDIPCPRDITDSEDEYCPTHTRIVIPKELGTVSEAYDRVLQACRMFFPVLVSGTEFLIDEQREVRHVHDGSYSLFLENGESSIAVVSAHGTGLVKSEWHISLLEQMVLCLVVHLECQGTDTSACPILTLGSRDIGHRIPMVTFHHSNSESSLAIEFPSAEQIRRRMNPHYASYSKFLVME